MTYIKDIHKEGKEKHIPELLVTKEGDLYRIEIEVGKEVKHPNLANHNINWVDIYFYPEGKEIVHLARVEFKAHGEFNNYTEPKAIIYAKLDGKGKIVAISYCTLHGLWQKEIEIP